MQLEVEDEPNPSTSKKEGMPVVTGRSALSHGVIGAGHHNHGRRGRGQPRFYPVTKGEPSSGPFTQDMPRKVSHIKK